MAAAIEAARQQPPDDAVARVLRRRRAEVAAIVRDDEALELVMDAAVRELDRPDDTAALASRQREFLASARQVESGMPSSAHVAALRRSTLAVQTPA